MLDLSIWRPQPPQGYHSIGDYAERTQSPNPGSGAIAIKEVKKDPKALSLLAAPIGYTPVWSSELTSGIYGHVSIWRPMAPPGYVALGYVANRGLSQPSLDDMKCVYVTATAQATVKTLDKQGNKRLSTEQKHLENNNTEAHAFRLSVVLFKALLSS